MNTFKAIRRFSSTKINLPRSVVIVAGKRTPVGTYLGKLSNIKATELASAAINATLNSTGLPSEEIRNHIDEVLLGNVVSSGLGQNPSRQASLGAKIPIEVPCSTVNKACASGMKTVAIGAQSIALGFADTVLAGGYESMSGVPFYVTKHRGGKGYGHGQLLDGLAHDGLTDAYGNIAMGLCAEKTAADFKLSREAQDEYAIASYERALKAAQNGWFKDEIAPLFISEKEGTLAEDEQTKKFNREKMPKLKPAFSKTGTITPANASGMNDGASSLLIMSEEKAGKLGLKPLARIVSFADHEVDPIDFCIAPTGAVKKCLDRAGMKLSDVDYHEINEAFAATVLANMKNLGLDHSRVNVHGGAVSIGHPIGASGGRILLALMNVLKQNKGKYGMASICNGGGGGSAMLLENLQL